MPASVRNYFRVMLGGGENNTESTESPTTGSSGTTTKRPGTGGITSQQGQDEVQEDRRQEAGMVVRYFEKWKDCCSFLSEHRILLVGVEIHKDAKTIDEFLDTLTLRATRENQKVHRDIAFVMGNEGQGLLDKQLNSCEAFVRIPQYGVGTASLNVYVAASVVLQRVHQWQRRQRVGHETGDAE